MIRRIFSRQELGFGQTRTSGQYDSSMKVEICLTVVLCREISRSEIPFYT